MQRGGDILQLPRVMGHRGAAALAPENTLAGIRAAKESGLDWVEFDTMLTRDGVPVLFHDDNLQRTTGRDALMENTVFADLASLEAGAWFDHRFHGEPVPSLEAALDLVLELGLMPNIEIKPTPARDKQTAAAVVEVLARRWPQDRPGPLVSSFSRKSLKEVKAKGPGLTRSLLAWRVPRDWKKAAAALECTNFHIAAGRLNAVKVERIKRAGYGLAAFTVNDPKKARRLVSWGVDCIISDVPDLILSALD